MAAIALAQEQADAAARAEFESYMAASASPPRSPSPPARIVFGPNPVRHPDTIVIDDSRRTPGQ